MSRSPNSLPNGPCLLFVDGQPMRVRRVDGRPDRPHPLLHGYDGAPPAPTARRSGPPR